MKLDIGCGNHKQPGYIGVDMFPGEDVDVVCDVEHKKLPFEDSTVEEVYTRHFLEHVDDFDFVLREIHRVCKDGAFVKIEVPHFTRSPYEWHKRHYRHNCFIDYEVDAKDTLLGVPKLFKCVSRKLIFNGFVPFEKFFNRHPQLYENSFLRSLFPCASVYVAFRVVKGNKK